MTLPSTQSSGELKLQGRIALVTGGAKRIGRMLALTLARHGARVVVHYLSSQEQAHAARAEIEAAGSQAALVTGDLAETSTAGELVQTASEAFGPVDILVNNASVFNEGSVEMTSPEEWARNQAVNLTAPFLLSQSFARLLPADRAGDIINLNDYRAVRPGSDHFAYTISKVGLHGLTRSLALALAPRIRVNELALGAVLPPEKASQEYMHALKQDIPTARFSRPEEVAEAMLLLLNNRSLTGQTVFVDGGRHLV